MSDQLLFSRDGGAAGNVWDDSALIRAWERGLAGLAPEEDVTSSSATSSSGTETTDSGDAAVSETGGLRAVESEATMPQAAAAAPRTGGDDAMPPFPAWADSRARDALKAWYMAGYWRAKAEV